MITPQEYYRRKKEAELSKEEREIAEWVDVAFKALEHTLETQLKTSVLVTATPYRECLTALNTRLKEYGWVATYKTATAARVWLQIEHFIEPLEELISEEVRKLAEEDSKC